MVLKILLVAALAAACTTRGGDMSAQPARKCPDWFAKGLVYQVQPRAFSPDGSLKGIKAKLPYIKELGVTVVYILPVFKMDEDMDKSFWSPRQIESGFENPKNQYRIVDYFHVDSEYGTDADLKDLVAAAHRIGLKVIFDLVYFHFGPTAPFLKTHPEFAAWNADGSIRKGKWRFPQFDFSKPSVREYLKTNLIYLMAEFDCDGFRCDVGARIPLDFWCEARDRMEAFKPDAILLCEGSCPANQTKAFDADYGRFPSPELFGRDSGKASARSLRSAWQKQAAVWAEGARFVNHYENHDFATDVHPRRETAWTHAGVDQVLVYMFTLDGVPLLFNGNEFAEASPNHSMFGRTPLDWSVLGTPEGRSRTALVKKLAEMRRSLPALTAINGRKGLEWLDVSRERDATAFVRRAPGCRSVVVVQNWRAVSLDVSVLFKAPQEDDAAALSIQDGEPILAHLAERTGKWSFRLGPYGYYVGFAGPEPGRKPARENGNR